MSDATSRDKSPVQVNARQALSLGVSAGLFLSFALTTALVLKFLNRPEGLKDSELFTSAPTGSTEPVFAPKTSRDPASGRYQVAPDEVNLTLAIGPEATTAELSVGYFYTLQLQWQPEATGPFAQTTIANVEVVAVDSAQPPERPKPTATLRLKRRDAEQFQQHRGKPGFRYRLESSGQR